MTILPPTRRNFLKSLAAATAVSTLPLKLAHAVTPNDARFVFVILRGAMDGLAAFPAYGDDHYASARKGLALSKPGTGEDSALDLDGFFGMHPALAPLLPLYEAKEMAVVHAVASPYRSRSHFDGQDALEMGSTDKSLLGSGWMNRMVATLNGSNAIAISPQLPMALQGKSPNVTSWFTKKLQPDIESSFMQNMLALYEHDTTLKPYLEQAIQAEQTAEMAMTKEDQKSGRKASDVQQFPIVTKACASFLKQDDGPRIAMLECAGWDTHANQGVGQGQLANKLERLADGLAVLKDELGESLWRKTVVVVATEFGRTVSENGTRGSDHGTASAAIVLGGTVKGGKVMGEWPGLAKTQLYQERDLKPTTDIRSVLKTILHEHLNINEADLNRDIFPDSREAKLIRGLI